MTFHYICHMKEEIKFCHQHLKVDYEDPDQYLVIVEIKDNVPVGNYVVKIPRSAQYFERIHPYYYHIPN